MRYNKLVQKNKITEVFPMNIISHFYKLLENSFNSFLKNHFLESNFWFKSSDFNNYISFMSRIKKTTMDLMMTSLWFLMLNL